MHRTWYYIETRSGADREQWLEMFGKAGLDRSDEFAPVYRDTKPRKPTGGTVNIGQLPDLQEALRSTGPGERMTIPHFGHLVSPCIWEIVAAHLVKVGATLESLADEVVLDGTDVAAGNALLKRRIGRALSDSRKLARVKVGRPKRTLTGKRLEEALRLFVDPDWSSDRIADHFDMGRMTLLRRIEDATGTMSKGEAIALADKGGWPPKRKLVR